MTNHSAVYIKNDLDAAAGLASDSEGAGRLHILAAAGSHDERTRVLKHGDLFAVFDRYGDIKPGGLGEEGLYYFDTRFLACLLLTLEGGRPFFLSSTVREENDQLSVTLTNPDLVRDGRVIMPLGTLHISLKRFLWQGTLHQQLRVKNYGRSEVETTLSLNFDADFADIFEVSGTKRSAQGSRVASKLTDNSVTLGYRGRDGVLRRSHIKFWPRPASLTESTARLEVKLRPQEDLSFEMAVTCQLHSKSSPCIPFSDARSESEADLERYNAWSCHLHTSNGHFNAWVRRSVSDLHMMTTDLPTGPYPYAGVPWFNTPFGRDGIITALECLWLRPSLSRGVLAYLASTQATEFLPEQDAEPGKILHETRCGEMAALREIPFGRYYGSVDATPLFIMLAGAYYERTGDLNFIRSLWPNIEAALEWIDLRGDRDGDGFVEYHRHTENGLVHQGWKDSDSALFHADGSLARGPIALCEVQGYVYAARRAAANLAEAIGHSELASLLKSEAAELREKFDQAFWCEELSTYVSALDGEKRPCRVRTSNSGQCLFTGIVRPDRAKRLARSLLASESYSGWGIRTLAASEAWYNPMAYHNGAVWPHDNALIALGLARYGLTDYALQILTGMFAAGASFDLHRMPELFCGFEREPDEGPILYPVACAPQAWAAASVFLLIQACLGLEVNALEPRICFKRPQLPSSIGEVRIHNLEVAGVTVDLLLIRHEHDVGLNVLRRTGDIPVIIND